MSMTTGQHITAQAALRTGVAATCALALAPWHAAAAPVACAAPQQTVFSCSTGTKTVSVCASADLAATTGAVQYRFGRPRAAELAYPPDGADWRAVTRGGTLAFSGGGGAYLAFEKAPYRYVVFTAVGKGWGSKAGVVVEQSGRRIATLACKGPVISELGPDLFSKAAIAPAESDFELP